MYMHHTAFMQSHRAQLYRMHQPSEKIELNQLQVPKSTDEFLWLNLPDPSATDLKHLLPPFIQKQSRVLKEMQSKHRRPKVVDYGDFCLVICITYQLHHGILKIGESQILFGQHFLVSIWRNTIFDDNEIRASLEQRPELISRGASYLAAEILNTLTDNYADQIAELEHKVEKVESVFFQGRFTSDDIEKAYNLRRSLLRLQSAIGPLSELTRRLSRQPSDYVSNASQAYFSEVADRIARLAEFIGVLRDTIAFAFEGGTMIIQLQQNDISRKLAAWAAILAIPTALAGIYGMNFKIMPELDWKFGYPIILGVMLVICLGLYSRFKRMRWL